MDEGIVFWLENEEGVEEEYEVIGMFLVDDQPFMALHPVSDPDVSSVALTGFHPGPDDEFIFDPIEDEETYQRVAEIFEMEFVSMTQEAQAAYDPTNLAYEIQLDGDTIEIEDMEAMEEPQGDDGFQSVDADDGFENFEDFEDVEDVEDFEDEEDEDFCYQDADGRLFILGENGERVYLNEYGEPIQ